MHSGRACFSYVAHVPQYIFWEDDFHLRASPSHQVLCRLSQADMAAPARPAAARKLNPALSWARAPPATVVKPSTRPSGNHFCAVSEADEAMELGDPVVVSRNERHARCQCACVPKRCVSAFMGASTVSQRGWMIYDWADSIFVVAST